MPARILTAGAPAAGVMLGIAPATMAEPVPQDGAPALVPRSTLSNSP